MKQFVLQQVKQHLIWCMAPRFENPHFIFPSTQPVHGTFPTTNGCLGNDSNGWIVSSEGRSGLNF